MQFSYFDAQKDVTYNYSGSEAVQKLDELLAIPFKNIHIETVTHDIQVQISKRGKVLVHQHRLAEPRPKPSLGHNRPKNRLLLDDSPSPFLQAIGIMTQDGKIRASKQKKFRQINEFLKLIVETGELEKFGQRAVNIVDCGCGSAHLTFSVYHYLSSVLGLQCQIVGIDVNADLLEKKAAQCQDLGWGNLSFQVTEIADFRPFIAPDIVLALHACDTATDDAIAQAIRWGAGMILCVPCCHHYLRQQLDQQRAPRPLEPVLRHGAFKERLSSMLTDSFRALILRIMGYRVDIVELVSTEFTGKNLMIRAIKSAGSENPETVQAYLDLKEYWQVTPYLEHLLKEELSKLIHAAEHMNTSKVRER
jgi:SAM-dependent methyltransferase